MAAPQPRRGRSLRRDGVRDERPRRPWRDLAAAFVCGALLGGFFLSPGCAGPAAQIDPDPMEALQAWALALEQERPRDAWALLASEAREGLDEEAFVELYARQQEELVERARGLLAWARAHPAAERAEVTVGSQRYFLVRTRDGWRIDGSSP